MNLREANRTVFISKSRNAAQYKDTSRGRNRWDRKKHSKIANSVKNYNTISMDKFFKQDILELDIPVVGETDEYTVSIRIEGVLEELAKSIKNNKYIFEYKTILQALTKAFNTSDIYIKCSCDDFKYRMAHWMIMTNMSTDDSSKDPGPGRGIANPNNDKGHGCKHAMLVLANGAWIMKVASVINNYCHYASEKMPKAYLKLVFPKLYGVPADEAEQNGLVEDNEELESGKDLIDVINNWARNRGKFKKGSNKNPVTGTGGRQPKTDATKNEQEEDTSTEPEK